MLGCRCILSNCCPAAMMPFPHVQERTKNHARTSMASAFRLPYAICPWSTKAWSGDHAARISPFLKGRHHKRVQPRCGAERCCGRCLALRCQDGEAGGFAVPSFEHLGWSYLHAVFSSPTETPDKCQRVQRWVQERPRMKWVSKQLDMLQDFPTGQSGMRGFRMARKDSRRNHANRQNRQRQFGLACEFTFPRVGQPPHPPHAHRPLTLESSNCFLGFSAVLSRQPTT